MFLPPLNIDEINKKNGQLHIICIQSLQWWILCHLWWFIHSYCLFQHCHCGHGWSGPQIGSDGKQTSVSHCWILCHSCSISLLTTHFCLGTFLKFLKNLLGFFNGNEIFLNISSDLLVMHDTAHISACQVPPVMCDQWINQNGTVHAVPLCSDCTINGVNFLQQDVLVVLIGNV